ncbi:MAG: nucleotide exchange factor GrpE [Bacteroidaceae bacterium]|nr:nucleotide exchange factor GrpE [Bacteroidaceae bacterium]
MSEEMKEKQEEEDQLKTNISENQQDSSQESPKTKKDEEPLESSATPEEATDSDEKEEDAPKEKTVEEKLADAEAEIESLKDKYLRKVAEFDNYHKRSIKEKADLILNGGQKTIVSILPVLDDMERALKNMEKAEDVAAVVEGVELIYKKFVSILEKQGVEAIKTENADFDVDVHEAIAQIPAPNEDMKGKVIDCTLKGYKLNDKVIRHAQVVVGL